MSKEALKIKPRSIWTSPELSAEDQELQTLMQDTNAPTEIQPRVSGVLLDEYVGKIGEQAVRSLAQAARFSPARIGFSLLNPSDSNPATGAGSLEQIREEYKDIENINDQFRDKFVPEFNRYFDVPLEAHNFETGVSIIKDDSLALQNLARWGTKGDKLGLIVDSKGTPISFMHGTPNKIGNSFDPKKTTSRSELKGAPYATTFITEAPKYMLRDGESTEDSRIHKLYIRMFKPLKLLAPANEIGMSAFALNDVDTKIVANGILNLQLEKQELSLSNPEDGPDIERIINQSSNLRTIQQITDYLDTIGSEIEITSFLESLGYDGVLQQNAGGGKDEYQEVIPFKKGSTKSSTDNDGRFRENDDIYSKTKKRRKKDLEIVA